MASLATRSVGAFAPAALSQSVLAPTMTTTACFGTTTDDETSKCDVPNGVDRDVRLRDQPRGGRILRDLALTAADGSTVTLDSKMGDGTSVVVFLRHLG